MSGVEGRIAPVGIDREYSRRNFLKTAAWAGAALSAAGIGGFGVAVRYAHGQGQPDYTTYQSLSDVEILQFAYLLELLEGTFYAKGVNAGLFSGSDLAQIKAIRDHEMAHADAISTTLEGLGAAVPPAPEFTYPGGTFGDPNAFLKLAATFEPVGIGAFSGAAPVIESKEILAAAGAILGVECEHRVAINILRGILPPNDLAFEPSLPLPEVLAAVEPFGVPV